MPAPSAAAGEAAQDSAMLNRSTTSQPSEPGKVRVDFRDTAFWKADVVTGEDGSATISVPLPDNLTTWRLTAQAVTSNSMTEMR